MNSLIDVMKQVAINAVEAGKPVNILYGTVASTSPLTIKISQQQILTKEFFLTVDPKPELTEGDTLILFRVQGGQKYLIIGKAADL